MKFQEWLARKILEPWAEKNGQVKEVLAKTRYLCDKYDDLSWCNLAPEPPIDDPPGEPPATGEWKVEPVWGRIGRPKIINAVCFEGDVFVGASNVYHSGNYTEIFRNGAKVFSERVETLTMWVHDGTLYATPEHGSHVLRWNGNTFVNQCRTAGRWSVCAHGPYAFFNDAYRGGFFHDHTKVISISDGRIVSTIPANTMPRTAVTHNDRIHVSANFGRECLAIEDNGGWKVYGSPAVTLCSAFGHLYGGYGMKAGPIPYRQPDGRIGRHHARDDWFPIFDTGCSVITSAVALDDCVLWVGTDPDRLYAMDRNERFTLLYERKGDSRGDKDRSFGGTICQKGNNEVYIGWSDSDDWSQMFKATRS